MSNEILKTTKRSVGLYIGVVITFFVMAIGITYAFFGVRVLENNTSSITIGTGVVDLSIEGQILNFNNVSPIYSEYKDTMANAYNFTVNNPSRSLNSCYSLDLLINSIDSELANQFLKWELTNNTDSTTTSGTFNNSSDGGTISIEQNKIINRNQTQNYTLRIWMEYDSEEDQTSMLGKSLNVSIKSTAYNGTCITRGIAVVYETSGMHEYTVSTAGYYEVELWGAKGGDSFIDGDDLYHGGYGGYTKGTIELNAGESLFVYVGGAGNRCQCSSSRTCCGDISGYNGGGNTFQYTGGSTYYGSGGGATDIRIVNGMWNSVQSLNSRIMVASGGGGASNYQGASASGYNYIGGSGGGLIGNKGTYTRSDRVQTCNGGYQTTFGVGTDDSGAGLGVGSFRVGYGPGGGGGYYGGGTSETYSCGGSSYISGYSGVNSVNNNTTITHNNETLHYSGKYFINGKMESGVQDGDGKASITFIGFKPKRVNRKLDGVRYIKDCINGRMLSDGYDNSNTWLEIQATYNGENVAHNKSAGIKFTSSAIASSPYSNLVDGKMDDSSVESRATSSNSGLQCVIIDLEQSYDLDEIAVWHWYFEYAKYEDNITYVTNDDLSSWTPGTDSSYNWIEVINNDDVETSEGKRVSAYEQ